MLEEQSRRSLNWSVAIRLRSSGIVEVERAHARLDVHDGHPRVLARLRAGEGRVGVPIDQHRVGLDLGDQVLQCAEHPGRLGLVRPAADAKFPVRFRETELGEEDLRKRIVVVLTRVDQDLLVLFPQQPRDSGSLDELRPVADDVRIFTVAA